MKFLIAVAMTVVATTSFAQVCSLKDVQTAQNLARKMDLADKGQYSMFANKMTSVVNPKSVNSYKQNQNYMGMYSESFKKGTQVIYRGSEFYYTNSEIQIEEGFSVHLKLDSKCKLAAYDLVEDVVCHR